MARTNCGRSGTGTFSIIAYDPATGEFGGAVQSRVFSVGNGVLWAEAGVGVVATQAMIDVGYGPAALALLRQGKDAETTLKSVMDADTDPHPQLKKAGRQFAVIDAKGNVVAYTGPQRKAVPYEFHADLIALARNSDVLVLACPANASTRRLVESAVINALGPSGYLVNVARGSIVDEAALAAALNEANLAGAALDVFDNEPDVPMALRQSSKVVLTPHTASATVETRTRMAELDA